MIPIAEINAKATKYNVPAETIEKDYMISWVLHCLSTTPITDQFVFRGGTAIKRVYFVDHRSSEHIDFLGHHSLNSKEIEKYFSCLTVAKDQANINFTIDPSRIEGMSDRIQFYIHYSGFDEIVGPPKEIKVDFCVDKHEFETTENKAIIQSYSDTIGHNHPLCVMTLNSIIANKLGMLNDMTRNEPRDLYDIWFLLNRAESFDFDPNQIKSIYKIYNVMPTLSDILHSLNNLHRAGKWENRLKFQVANMPKFGGVIKDIQRMLYQYHF